MVEGQSAISDRKRALRVQGFDNPLHPRGVNRARLIAGDAAGDFFNAGFEFPDLADLFGNRDACVVEHNAIAAILAGQAG